MACFTYKSNASSSAILTKNLPSNSALYSSFASRISTWKSYSFSPAAFGLPKSISISSPKVPFILIVPGVVVPGVPPASIGVTPFILYQSVLIPLDSLKILTSVYFLSSTPGAPLAWFVLKGCFPHSLTLIVLELLFKA